VIDPVRVIAGSLKGRRLRAPTWDGLRPTSDKMRETLFNVLAPRVEGARVLDAYAGTGAVGIEAISRGAVEVAFVEHERRAQALIAENLARCGVARGCVIIRASVDRALEDLRDEARPFDIVLLDPPYGQTDLDTVLSVAGALVTPDGVLVLEHATRQRSPDAAGPLRRIREVTSGDSALAFYGSHG
jgi:16S rRNA (guanine966-N2)-methyltransferase